MTDEQVEFFTKRTEDIVKSQPRLLVLRYRLLGMGGEAVVLWNGNNDPAIVELLLKKGAWFNPTKIKMVKGKPSQCHENAAELAKRKQLILVTGFGLSKDGIWRPHSWCMSITLDILYETTLKRDVYFGVKENEGGNEKAS